MKRILLLICLSVVTLNLSAQRYGLGPRHEMRVGVGLLPMSNFDLDAFVIDRDCSAGGFYDRTHLYVGDIYKSPSISFSYTGRLARWFELGFVASYHSAFAHTYTRKGDVKEGHFADHYLHIMPTARFVWLRRDLVRMYSSVGLGITSVHVGCAKPTSTEVARRSAGMIFSFEIVGVGISVGRRVFGFAELGVASRGFFNVGVGCRLFSQKQKRNGEIY